MAFTQNMLRQAVDAAPLAPHQDEAGGPHHDKPGEGDIRQNRTKPAHHLGLIGGKDKGAAHDHGAGKAAGGAEHQADQMQKQKCLVHFNSPC